MNKPIKEWFKEQWEYNDSDYELLDSALVQRQTLYGAVRQKSTGDVFCAVFLIRWARGYYNFSYKGMTEHVGPCEHNCPEKIFKLLTPLNNENDSNGWAQEWREKVKRLHKNRKEIKKGKIFKVKNPVNFGLGSYEYFRRLKDEPQHEHCNFFKRNGNRFCVYTKKNNNIVLASTKQIFKFDPENYLIEKFIEV